MNLIPVFSQTKRSSKKDIAAWTDFPVCAAYLTPCLVSWTRVSQYFSDPTHPTTWRITQCAFFPTAPACEPRSA